MPPRAADSAGCRLVINGEHMAGHRSSSTIGLSYPALEAIAPPAAMAPPSSAINSRRFGDRDIEPIQGDRYHAIQTNEIDELGCPFLPECRNRLPGSQLRADAARDQSGGEIIGDGLLARKAAWALAGNDRGYLVVRETTQFRDQHMRVDFIGGVKLRTRYQDSDLSNWFGKRRRRG